MQMQLGPDEIRDFFILATDEEIDQLLFAGLQRFIEGLEEDDYFGTEGFMKRFS